MEKTELTCVECPIGCRIEVEKDGEKVVSVVGNSCPRGKIYAENEVVCPKRVVTSTVRATCEKMIPVKTDRPVRKSEIFAVMQKINSFKAVLPVKAGEILIENVDEDANLVATANVDP